MKGRDPEEGQSDHVGPPAKGTLARVSAIYAENKTVALRPRQMKPFNMETAERAARRALVRLQRSLEKTRRELTALRGALETAEGGDFPTDQYEECDRHLCEVGSWANIEGRRLQSKILAAGGLEPGRVRRSSS